jgi:prepilin-type N-terminal cleavage/methylation domain-containing protein
VRRPAGFTLLELLIAMSIFAVLGTAAVILMQQGAALFGAGARESELSDRQDDLLPELKRDLARLCLPDRFDPPPLPPDETALGGAPPPPPPPPVAERLRSGTLLLREAADSSVKSQPCTYLSFVISTGDEGHDPRLRTAGDTPPLSETAKAFTKAEVDKSARGTVFLPTGGRMEVCWIAVPMDPRYPGVLSVFRGYRAPVGGPETLLDPANFDTVTKIRAKFDLRHEGVLQFTVTWRRVIADTWNETVGRAAGDDVPYVGPMWDSTRALERTWPLHKSPASLSDPSDDWFPQYVRLEATVAPASFLGYGRGEARLNVPVGSDDLRVALDVITPLMGPGPADGRWLKVENEWMRFDRSKIDIDKREVPVERGQRGTTKVAHDAGADAYVGQAAVEVIRLPVWRDRTVRRGTR